MIDNEKDIIKPFNLENKKSILPQPKKRGRKSKNKLISNVVSKEENNFVYDNIIVNLPVKMSDITEEKNNKKIESIYENNETTKLFTSDISSSDNDEYNEIEELKKECLEYKNEIEKLKKKLNKINSNEKEEGVYKMNIDFVSLDGEKQEYKLKTDIYCWWCCHQFKTVPCQLPEKFFNDKFYVFGCFCSYNCALSYNLDLNDYKVNERTTLLHYMYKRIYNKDINIKKSLPRQTLKIFGGILSIEKFRKDLLNNDVKYNFIMPPLCSLIPLIEVDSIKKKNRISVSKKKENTIENFLGLKKK